MTVASVTNFFWAATTSLTAVANVPVSELYSPVLAPSIAWLAVVLAVANAAATLTSLCLVFALTMAMLAAFALPISVCTAAGVLADAPADLALLNLTNSASYLVDPSASACPPVAASTFVSVIVIARSSPCLVRVRAPSVVWNPVIVNVLVATFPVETV